MLVTACGQLSVPRIPPIPGLDDFAGPAFHTARWRHDVDLAGKRVALVGTGCSSIQIGPSIQPEVAQLDVYQRSPGWTIPKMDFAYGPRARRCSSACPLLQRLDRQLTFAFMEAATAGMTQPPLARSGRSRPSAAGRSTRRSTIRSCAARSRPTDEIGCKRIMLTDDWYPTLTKPNVELVTDRIEHGHAGGLRTADGVERPADVLSSARASARTASSRPMEVAGRGGRTLAEAWAGVPRAYLGITVPGFPNMFLLYGPEHQRRRRLGHLHGRGGQPARDRGDPRARARRARARSSCARGGRGLRPRAARGTRRHGLAHAAARTGTWTRTAPTRTSGRGSGAVPPPHRRRWTPRRYELA